jgi:hypothetical protein
MNDVNKVYIKSEYQKLKSLIADESKSAAMLDDMAHTIKQLRAKTTFRLALLNQLRETIEDKGENK